MNAVDSAALDPLVFEYISCGVSDIVNNLWTWLAVLTAAVSFWRIRTAGGGESPSTPPSRSSVLRLTLQVPTPDFVLRRKLIRVQRPDSVSDEVPVSTTPKTPASSPIVCDDDDVVTKGKFVAYYREEAEERREEDVVVFDDGEVLDGGNGGVGKGWLGTALRVRMEVEGELGWYRYQDLTAINGNVVRLWDGVRSGDGECCHDDGIGSIKSKCNPRCCLVW